MNINSSNRTSIFEFQPFLCKIFIMKYVNPLLLKKLEETVKKDPASTSFCALARIYQSQGRKEEAEKICLEGLAHKPFYSQAYVILGEIYKERGEMEKAIQIFNKAKERNPDNPNIYKNLGEIYKKQNDIEKTLRAYKMVSFLKPGDKTAGMTVQHLEKLVGTSPSAFQEKRKDPLLKSLSPKQSQRLAKLNKILARVEIYMDKHTEKC